MIAGQPGLRGIWYASPADGAKMTCLDWLPEIGDSWRSGPVELTPTTSGLQELVLSTRLERRVCDDILGPGTVRVSNLWADGVNGVAPDNLRKNGHDFAIDAAPEDLNHDTLHASLAPKY